MARQPARPYSANVCFACGEAHFKALTLDEDPARYVKATKLEDMLKHI
jgi:hypothetical protein